jgi:hypothetical protein
VSDDPPPRGKSVSSFFNEETNVGAGLGAAAGLDLLGPAAELVFDGRAKVLEDLEWEDMMGTGAETPDDEFALYALAYLALVPPSTQSKAWLSGMRLVW